MAEEKKPKPVTKRGKGRPKGSKNIKTLVKEARATATATAKKALQQSTPKGKKGKKSQIDVAEICIAQGFDPVTEALIMYREIEADPFDLDGRKTRLEILKMIFPFYAPKKKPQEDTGTGRGVPIFQVHIGVGSDAPAPIQVGSAPTVSLPDPDVVDVPPEDFR